MRSSLPGPSAAVLAAAVFASSALAVTGLVHGSGSEIADTGRYRHYGLAMRDGLVPYRDFDVEYPPGALLAFLAPALAVSGEERYFWAFAAQVALAGAIGVLLTAGSLKRLRRSARARRAVLALLAVSPLAFGGVLLTRFDLIPAALVAAATLLLLRDRPRRAGLVLGAAAAVKLYPLTLLPLLAAWAWRRHRPREAIVAGGLALGVAAAAYAPFLLLAPGGVFESLWEQLSRPLQIESLGAGVLVLLHHLAGLEVAVETSSGSQNLTGGTATGVAVSLSVLAALALAGLWIAFARGSATRERLARFGAAALVALVAFGKVLSPQFLVWLLFGLALAGGRRGRAAGACFAVAAVATAIWFPWLYFDLPRALDPFVASLVVLRGLALVGALAALARPGRDGPARASTPARDGAEHVRGAEEVGYGRR